MTPHLVDATLFFSRTSGGVRRYLLAKHAWLTARSRLRHTLFVPGEHDTGRAGGLVEFGSPRLWAGYRCPVRLPALRAALAAFEPDLIEAGDPYLMGWQVTEVARTLQVPAVAFCHSDVINLMAQRLGRPGAVIAAHYLRALYERFDLVLAPSAVVADHLRLAGVANALVQPLGVDPRVFDPARRDLTLRTRLGLASHTRLLVFAGRLAPEKNVRELYAMVERLGAPYHLLVIGAPEPARPTPSITLLPYLSSAEQMAATLAACDALVHAGRQETFGLVALEAMACGIPVVAYAAGAMPEFVDATVGELAPPTGPAALAEAVDRLFMRDPPARGATARARVLSSHTWDATFARQLRHYARLLNQASLLHDAPTLLPA
ncbi:MAG TPA: glycosyltransferase [Steroidobacteraceae bacterium]|nr:glycosyltransferase [Steroidobacteraceae bacterium]